jgi:hypothetical protein
MTLLHFAGDTHELAGSEDPDRLVEHIELKLRERGGWVHIDTHSGPVSILVWGLGNLMSSGVPIWLDRRERQQTGFGV